jgi:hypothetical protein
MGTGNHGYGGPHSDHAQRARPASQQLTKSWSLASCGEALGRSTDAWSGSALEVATDGSG